MAKGFIKRFHIVTERLLFAVGVLLLVIVTAALIHRSVASRLALAEFDKSQAAFTQQAQSLAQVPQTDEKVDSSLWSEKRTRDYRASILMKKDSPMAVLAIEKFRLKVPVFEGTDDLVLNRGAGWIEGTARPGVEGPGNIGIAGHRDGFFRSLKDIRVGEAVELATPGLVSRYVVDEIEIVLPDNVGVLRPRGAPSLTLVTCYPFYFVGDAPKRFIVHASLNERVPVGGSGATGLPRPQNVDAKKPDLLNAGR